MRYVSGKVGVYESFEYAKNIIGKVKDIKEFKVFKNDKTPYYEDYGIEKKYYNFIIKDYDDNEVWFDSNCGYAGTGPSYTEKILQLFGAREDYGIDRKPEVEVSEVELNHDINLLVLVRNRLSGNVKEKMFIRIKPNLGRDRLNIVNGLKNIGSFSTYYKEEVEYNKYFEDLYVDNSLGEYRVNSLFYISRHMGKMSSEDLKQVFKTIISRNIGEASEFEIEIL